MVIFYFVDLPKQNVVVSVTFIEDEVCNDFVEIKVKGPVVRLGELTLMKVSALF